MTVVNAEIRAARPTTRREHVDSPRYADAAKERLREHVLDAVAELLRARPWGELKMAEIAVTAGVSRQTLYNAFGSRPELAQAYVIREADRFLAAVEDAIRGNASQPRTALAAALEVFLSAAETHPLIRAITSGDGSEELLPLVTTRGGPLVEMVTERLSTVLVATWPTLSPVTVGLVADTLVRLAISHAALPAKSPRATAAAIAGLLAPSVDALLGSETPIAAGEASSSAQP